jgi:hypothetical protein
MGAWNIFVTEILLAVCLLTAVGCASNLTVTYYSDPPGAALYQGSQSFGYTPQTLTYHISEDDRKKGYIQLQGMSVKWASGASAEIGYLQADLNAHGTSQQLTFNRPDSYPGREADVRFALELERLRIMQRQAAAQESQALWQMYNALIQQNRPPSPRNCTSTLFGNTVNTTCY